MVHIKYKNRQKNVAILTHLYVLIVAFFISKKYLLFVYNINKNALYIKFSAFSNLKFLFCMIHK
jgi:hypothetical protein